MIITMLKYFKRARETTLPDENDCTLLSAKLKEVNKKVQQGHNVEVEVNAQQQHLSAQLQSIDQNHCLLLFSALKFIP